MPFSDPVQQAEYQRRWLASRRARATVMLGGKCSWCDATENLEFDHIRPSTKDPKVCNGTGGIIWSHSWARIVNELSKCWLLCQNCHRIKTRDDKPDILHGTHTRYVWYDCRCSECRKAHAVTNAKYR